MNKIKNIKKKIIAISTTIIMLVLNILGLTNSVYAAQIGESAKLEKISDCGSLLAYNGIPVITTFVAYNDGASLNPAYCLNANIPGVGEAGSYTVSTKDFITDVGLWRRAINGYPYKTIQELGCATKEEAFTATKHAIYCYVHGNNPDSYSAIGEAGQRTLNAMKGIIERANASTETKLQPDVKINKDEISFKLDNLDKNYVSKTYQVQANADFKTYKVSLEKSGQTNLPQGIKIANINNKEQTTFQKGEKFKILIPIKNIKNKGEFSIKTTTELKTKPVLYGKAPNSNLQDYAVSTLKYEDGIGTLKDNYDENNTKIIITKQEKDTKKALEGVTFDLLNSKKEVINAGLKTDKNGKIEIKGIAPGKYYLKETKTLEGYVKYDDEIEINIDFNEEFKVVVNNTKEKKIEVEKSIKELTVEQNETKTAQIVNAKQEEITKNIEEKTTNENIVQTIVKKNVKKLPVTGM